MSKGRDMSLQYFGDGQSILKNAIALDNSGNAEQAKKLYTQAVSKFKLSKMQKGVSEQIASKCQENIERCEARIQELDSMAPASAPSTSSGGVSRSSGNSGKPKKKSGGGGSGGGGGGGADEEGDEFDKKMEGAILVEKPDVKWTDVAGLAEAKRSLMEAVILPLKFKQFFQGERSPWRGILLYGPPGTGKSFLAKATATEANNSTFLTVSTSDLVSKWLGESEKLIRSLFDMARKKAPAIIFIDEIDSLLSERSESDSESARRIKTEFLIQMDGVGKSMDGVLLLAATNIPWGLDSAVRRRFEKKIYIPLPDYEARLAMIQGKMKKTFNNLTPEQMTSLAQATEGYSGADIKILTREAAMLSIRKLQAAQYFCEYQGQLYKCEANYPGAMKMNLMDDNFPADKVATPPVTYEDFLDSLGKIRPSVSPADLGVFEKWTKEFGTDGTGG